MEFTLSPETLSIVAGVVLTLLFSYVPGLNVLYQTLTPTWKSLLMLGLLVVVSAGAFGLACAGWIQGLACTPMELQRLVWCLVLAIIANQSIYKISPPTPAVSAAKLAVAAIDASNAPIFTPWRDQPAEDGKTL